MCGYRNVSAVGSGEQRAFFAFLPNIVLVSSGTEGIVCLGFSMTTMLITH